MNAFNIKTFIDENKKHTVYCATYKLKKNITTIYWNNTECVLKRILNLICQENLSTHEIFYTHNLNFDGILLLSILTTNSTNLKFDIFMKSLNIYSIKIFHEKKCIEFKCSYKLLPVTLKQITSDFNLSQKMAFPYYFSIKSNLFHIGKLPEKEHFVSLEDYYCFNNNYNSNIFDFQKYTIMYCENEARIISFFVNCLYNIIISTKLNLKSIYSTSALSLKIFINRYNDHQVSFKRDVFLDTFVKNAFFGGRCEIYGNANTDEFIYHFDFSGMYAQCMKEKFIFGDYEMKNNKLRIDEPGFYCIEYTSDLDIPVLPHHELASGKLLFTNGKNIGIFWYEEILLFLEMGGQILKILYAIIYKREGYIFEKFIHFFEEIRKKGGSYKTFSKLAVNSLYGRLGMTFSNKHTFFIKKEDFDFYNKITEIISFIEINDMILLECEINDNLKKICKIKTKINKSNIALAAIITAKARIKLYRAQQDVIKNNGRLLYSDTDSIFAAYKTNVLNERHGEIFWNSNKKNTVISDAVFIASKTYALKINDREIIKIKGANNFSTSFNEIKEGFYNNTNLNIKNFSYIDKSSLELIENKISKIFNLSTYDKRIFILNKKFTRPLNYKNYEYK